MHLWRPVARSWTALGWATSGKCPAPSGILAPDEPVNDREDRHRKTLCEEEHTEKEKLQDHTENAGPEEIDLELEMDTPERPPPLELPGSHHDHARARRQKPSSGRMRHRLGVAIRALKRSRVTPPN